MHTNAAPAAPTRSKVMARDVGDHPGKKERGGNLPHAHAAGKKHAGSARATEDGEARAASQHASGVTWSPEASAA